LSFEVTCDIVGIEEFQAALATFEPALQDQVYRFLHGWASDVKAEAMHRVPVRSGYLRSRIYAIVRDWVAMIGAEATYALFVELGTTHMRAQPYIYPAIQEYLPQLEDVICWAIDKAKAEAGLP
jgi:hypothetical protein